MDEDSEVITETVRHLKPQFESEYLRLGDAFAVIAQPIAKGIDTVFGSNIQGCGGCVKRKDKLNRLVRKRNS